MNMGRRRTVAVGLTLAAAALAGCNQGGSGVAATSGFQGADVDAIVGQCTGSGGQTTPRQGMSQCDLIRSQGRPRDAVIAEMPDGRRRVELFYPGNGGTTRGYVFVADRLVSTPPGTLKE